MILMVQRRSHPHLTPAERQVLRLVAQVYTNSEIAQILGISERNARNKVHMIMRILGINDRIQLIRFAQEQGYAERDYPF